MENGGEGGVSGQQETARGAAPARERAGVPGRPAAGGESRARRMARYLAVANLVVGTAGSIGPFVTGNDDRVVNVRSGRLFGLFAINGMHALKHLVLGAVGLRMHDSERRARRYLRLQARVFGFIAAAGWWKTWGRTGIHTVLGTAVNKPSNVVHTLWTTAALWGTRGSARGRLEGRSS